MLELFHGASRGSLFRFFFCAAFARGHALSVHPHLDRENLLVVWPAFRGKAIFRRGASASLQKFLQCGFAIRFRDALTALFQSLLEQQPSQHLSRRTQPCIEVNPCDHGFEGIRQERLLIPPPGFLFATPQPKMLAEP
jgi:hypothetical protein